MGIRAILSLCSWSAVVCVLVEELCNAQAPLHSPECLLSFAPMFNLSEATLLAIAQHFNHPVFANIGWVDQAPNMTVNESLPCGKVMGLQTWDFVQCINDYVYSM